VADIVQRNHSWQLPGARVGRIDAARLATRPIKKFVKPRSADRRHDVQIETLARSHPDEPADPLSGSGVWQLLTRTVRSIAQSIWRTPAGRAKVNSGSREGPVYLPPVYRLLSGTPLTDVVSYLKAQLHLENLARTRRLKYPSCIPYPDHALAAARSTTRFRNCVIVLSAARALTYSVIQVQSKTRETQDTSDHDPRTRRCRPTVTMSTQWPNSWCPIRPTWAHPGLWHDGWSYLVFQGGGWGWQWVVVAVFSGGGVVVKAVVALSSLA